LIGRKKRQHGAPQRKVLAMPEDETLLTAGIVVRARQYVGCLKLCQ